MTLETSKNLGGVGIILMIVSPLGIAGLSFVLGVVGLILLLIGLKGMADHYKEQGIFNNALYGFIIGIVGVVVVIAVVVVTLMATLASLGINLMDINSWSAMGPTMGNMFRNMANFSTLWTFIGAIVVSLVVLFVFLIVAAIFIRRSLTSLAKKTGVHLFETAGILMLVGAALTIIAVGLLLIWVSLILIAVAFFSIKVK